MDPFAKFWAYAGAATFIGAGIITTALVLKDQQGAVAILGAGSGLITNTVGAFGKLG